MNNSQTHMDNTEIQILVRHTHTPGTTHMLGTAHSQQGQRDQIQNTRQTINRPITANYRETEDMRGEETLINPRRNHFIFIPLCNIDTSCLRQIDLYILIYIQIYLQTYIQIYIQTYIQIYIQIYIYLFFSQSLLLHLLSLSFKPLLLFYLERYRHPMDMKQSQLIQLQ